MSHPFLLKNNSNLLPIDVYKAWKRKKTQVEMLKDRGYTISTEELMAIRNKKKFLKYYENVEENMDKVYIRERDGHKLSVIYNIVAAKAAAKQHKIIMAMIEDQYQKEIAFDFILITISPMKNLAWLKELKFVIEVFNYDELAINPTKHFLTQKHILLTNKERNTLYQNNSIQPKEMPGISIHNPIVKYYNAKLHDVFRIERDTYYSYLIDTFIYYREVKDIPILASSISANDNEEADDDEGDDNEELLEEFDE